MFAWLVNNLMNFLKMTLGLTSVYIRGGTNAPDFFC